MSVCVYVCVFVCACLVMECGGDCGGSKLFRTTLHTMKFWLFSVIAPQPYIASLFAPPKYVLFGH